MIARFLMPLLLSACSCGAQVVVGLSAQMKTQLQEEFKYSPVDPSATPEKGREVLSPEPPSDDESVLRLEPFTVTAFTSFRDDVAEAARRAAAAREAAKFSPLKGGLIFAKQIGPVDFKLGIWPKLIPYTVDSPAKQSLRLSVDVIRINW